MPPAPGTRLGPYEILDRIGAGGMGEVYRARDPKLNRDVAIKILPGAFAEDPERLRRFQQEAQVLAVLGHPDVVQVFDAGEDGGQPYLVMELLAGETLRQRLDQGRLPWRRAVEFAAAVAEGLAAAHAKGITHRDLKPENLFLTEHGRVKILDFGLARLKSPTIGTATTVDTAPTGTLDGALLGTVGYMAPEQVRGQPADPRSDVFALGCVLYEMVTGTPAFRRDTTVDTLSAILKEPVPEASLSGSGATPELDRILAHCLEKAPEDRFQNTKDLAFDLRSLLAGAPAGVSAPLRPARRPRLLAGAGLLVLLVAAVLALWAPWRPPSPPWEPNRVAFLPFENRSGDPALDVLARQVVERARLALQAQPRLQIAPDQPPPAPGSPLRRLGELTRARYLATGSLEVHGDQIEFQARLLDPWHDTVAWTLGPWSARRDAPAPALDACSQVLAAALFMATTSYLQLNPGAIHIPRMDAYLEFLKGIQARSRDDATAAACFRETLAKSPEFVWADWNLYHTCMALGRFEEAGEVVRTLDARFIACTPVEQCLARVCKADFQGRNWDALKAWQDLREIHPDTTIFRWNRAYFEVCVNLPGRAARDLQDLRADWAGFGASAFNLSLPRLRSDALHMQGDHKAELRCARDGAAANPARIDLEVREASALAALGQGRDVEAAVRTFQGQQAGPGDLSPAEATCAVVRELRAHGQKDLSRALALRFLDEHPQTPPDEPLQATLASLLVLAERFPQALEAASALRLAHPGKVQYLGLHGALLARLGRVEEARNLAADLAVPPAPFLYGEEALARARVLAALGDRAAAVAALQDAFNRGWNYSVDLHRDEWLEPLRGYPPFEDLMRPKD